MVGSALDNLMASRRPKASNTVARFEANMRATRGENEYSFWNKSCLKSRIKATEFAGFKKSALTFSPRSVQTRFSGLACFHGGRTRAKRIPIGRHVTSDVPKHLTAHRFMIGVLQLLAQE